MPQQVDASVLQQIPDYAPNPIKAQADALTLQGMQQNRDMGGLELTAAKQKMRDEAQARQALKGVDLSNFGAAQSALSKIQDPNIRMKIMGELNKQGQQQREISLADMEMADHKLDILGRALDPIVAQLEQFSAPDPRTGRTRMTPADLDAKTKQAVIPALLQLRASQPAVAAEIDRFLQDPNHLTFQGLKSVDAQTKWGSQAIKDRITEKRQQESERHNLEMERLGQERIGGKGGGAEGEKVSAVYAAMADQGVSFPSGMRSVQAQHQTITGLIKAHPDDTPEQIAQRVKSGELGFKAAGIEAGVVARREGQAAPAINALNREGGLYDQVLEVGRKIDMGSDKLANAFRLWRQGKVIADPDLSEYVNTLVDTRAEFASVLARGGQVTDSVRIASEHAFPDKMSLSELQRNVERSKKIAEAIQSGNTSVADAIINGKSMEQALKSPASAPKGGGIGPFSDPEKEKRYQEWKRTHPNG